ncbi:putative nitrogen metabolic regulation protein nmr [Coleophoma crateriformis]|uniref:Putative nitrogen metabolic regulation protein nmr n=1 Tax=Coleophoma crateriformis TaxID=565419 RepID=A0A3D8SA76_9HELO|nr:putative nitrogen metabolic regulation protein nmr [Coleophoma crateriformis]
MPSATPRSIAIRPREEQTSRKLKHAPSTSYPTESYLNAAVQFPIITTHHAPDRPTKRPMPTPNKTIAVVNSSGRQAASFIRVASAVGFKVRAQLRNLDGIVATEISELPNVQVIVGDLYTRGDSSNPPSPGNDKNSGVNHALIKRLFDGAQLAFINTTFYGDEVAIGKALADAAKEVGIEHYIYSSMPDHSTWNPAWPSLPLWSSKYAVEKYIRSIGLPSTFLYTGIYNNNFTSLPYPLFCMELQSDGSFLWTAPFHPDIKLPWLDAEHDVGAAVLQLIKDGISQWGSQRIALAYEMLTPREVCRAFARGIGRPVRYCHSPVIEVKVKIPAGYRDQLTALEQLYAIDKGDGSKQPPYFGHAKFEATCPEEALALWEGNRGMEEYAREVFPLEEAANGLTWMNEDDEPAQEEEQDTDGEGDSDDEGLTMGGGIGSGDATPARKEEGWLA